jgi:hypothetical protein
MEMVWIWIDDSNSCMWIGTSNGKNLSPPAHGKSPIIRRVAAWLFTSRDRTRLTARTDLQAGLQDTCGSFGQPHQLGRDLLLGGSFLYPPTFSLCITNPMTRFFGGRRCIKFNRWRLSCVNWVLRQSTRTSIATGCPLKGSIRGVPLNKAFLRVFWSKCSPVAQTTCHRERQHEKVSQVRDERRFCRFLFQSSSVILRGKQSLYVFLDKTLIILRQIDIFLWSGSRV